MELNYVVVLLIRFLGDAWDHDGYSFGSGIYLTSNHKYPDSKRSWETHIDIHICGGHQQDLTRMRGVGLRTRKHSSLKFHAGSRGNIWKFKPRNVARVKQNSEAKQMWMMLARNLKLEQQTEFWPLVVVSGKWNELTPIINY